MIRRTSISLDEFSIVRFVPGTREALHAASTEVYKQGCELVNRRGAVVDQETGEESPRVFMLALCEAEDDRTLRQNRFYFGVVLKQISEQARVAGQQYTAEAWHELGKRQFLGYEVIKAPVAGRKRVQVYRRLRSTTDLTVKQMSEYLDAFIAFAADDLGVVFEFDQQERESVRYRRPARKRTPQAAEAAA